jgi:hypothetical protein
MKIACLGWGSLIWNPKSLLIKREWFKDGPLLPIDFTRQSLDGRLTLVICVKVKPVRTLWALMATEDLTIAKKSLQIREGIGDKSADKYINSITFEEVTEDVTKSLIQKWAKLLNIDAVIWTALPSKFNGVDNKVPTEEEAIIYLKNLDVNTQYNAQEYIRKTPKQIDTEYRRKFEIEFGWTYIE